VNLRIKNSKVFKKNPNYKYTSQMFRKTAAYTEYQKGLQKLRDKISDTLGQAKKSSALDFYIR
jgi:hypothetical protein